MPKIKTPALALIAFALMLASAAVASDVAPRPERGRSVEPSSISVCFSGSDFCRQILLDEIATAKKSIFIAIYSFTNLDISRALIAAHTRGVTIKVVADDSQASGKYSKTQFLEDSGIPVRYDDSKGYMHHKFAIFDERSVATGSYNWSDSAENRNQENLILIADKSIAKEYKAEFDRLWETYQ